MNKEFKTRLQTTIKWTFFTLALSFILSIATAYFEKDVNPGLKTWGNVVWWWIVTISGIGYGDIYPITFLGKLFGSLVMFLSIFLLAIAVSEVTALIKLATDRKDKGIIRINYKGHIVIYGYTSLSAGVIKLLHHHFGQDLKIVLVSNDITKNPFPGQVDFIYANPITKSTFIEANTKEAIAAIILANDRFNDPDAYSLVIATGLEKDNSKLVTLVELIDSEMRSLFKQSKIDAFIDRKELLKDLLEQNKNPKLIRIINKETDLDEKIEKDTKIDLV